MFDYLKSGHPSWWYHHFSNFWPYLKFVSSLFSILRCSDLVHEWKQHFFRSVTKVKAGLIIPEDLESSNCCSITYRSWSSSCIHRIFETIFRPLRRHHCQISDDFFLRVSIFRIIEVSFDTEGAFRFTVAHYYIRTELRIRSVNVERSIHWYLSNRWADW